MMQEICGKGNFIVWLKCETYYEAFSIFKCIVYILKIYEYKGKINEDKLP